MSEAVRTGTGDILSGTVRFDNIIFCQGVTAADLSKDIAGQTAEVLSKIDALLQEGGSDKSRLLQAQIWLKDIRDRDAMNEVWSKWLPAGKAPARACVQANMASPRHLIEVMVVVHV
jgi:enamine deaminase RidA (YjgF/YER057c/UK114 family)